MLSSVIALLLLLLAASGVSAVSDRRIETCWPVCYCGVIGWLYGFYCFGIVRLGLLLLCAGVVGIFLAGLKKCGSFRNYCRRIWTPGTVVYLCFCLIFLIFFSRNQVTRHDELRLWGAVPKAIYETGRLQLGSGSPIFSTMQSYPPALPLIEYYFTAFSTGFSEGALFVGYACMAMSFFIPAFSQWEWRHWPLLAPVGLAVLLTPFVFTSHFGDEGFFGMTLYVDPLLGIGAGYAVFLAGHHPLRDRFCLCAFSLTLATLCLLKDTGAVFAVTALILAFALDRKSWSASSLLPIGAAGVAVGSWKLLLKLYGVHALVPLRLHALSAEAVKNVFRALLSENMVLYGVPLGFFLSFVFLSAVLWALYYLAFRFQSEQSGREAGGVAMGILVSTAGFVYGYSLIYGETLESFPRYMATVLLELAACILLTAIPSLTAGKLTDWALGWTKRVRAVILCACVVVGVSLAAAWRYVFPVPSELPAADEDASRIRAAVERDMSQGETGWIYLVMAGDGWENSRYHHRIFFDLISPRINLRNGLAQTQVVVPGLAQPAQVWAEELADGCDYVYLLSVEDDLLPVFAELSDDPAQEHGLYRVCKEAGEYGIRLRQVPDLP